MIYTDKRGYNKYKICRSSDIEMRSDKNYDEKQVDEIEKNIWGTKSEFKVQKGKKNQFIQRQKLMIIKYLKDKIGSMVCYEYLIDQSFEKTTVRPVGKVNIYFSKKLLEKNYFNYLDSSHIIPSYSQNVD